MYTEDSRGKKTFFFWVDVKRHWQVIWCFLYSAVTSVKALLICDEDDWNDELCRRMSSILPKPTFF